jgi:hypothetical protein
MDFIDEEEVALLQVSKDARKVACFLDLRAGGGVESGACGGGDDVGEGGFAESGRAGEEDVFEDVVALFGGFDHEDEAVFDFFLAMEVVEVGGAQGDVEGAVFFGSKFGVKGIGHALF